MTDFIRFAHSLNGPVPGALLEGYEIARALEAEELAWVHLSADAPESNRWIEDNLGYLPAPVRQALVARITRPRLSLLGGGALLILRGVNTNPGAEPEDMVSLRMWIDPHRIVSLSLRPLASVAELREAIAAGQGPQDAGGFVASLVERLNARIVARVGWLDEAGDTIEDEVLKGQGFGDLPARITDIRQEVVDLRRILRPQRVAIAALAAAPLAFVQGDVRLRLDEAHDSLTRSVEDLEGLAERMVVARDEIANANSDRLNRNLYLLSVISAVFLPLSFLTGLMGINLAGMPGADWPPAFWVFTAGLGGVLVLQLLLLWRLRWVRMERRRKNG